MRATTTLSLASLVSLLLTGCGPDGRDNGNGGGGPDGGPGSGSGGGDSCSDESKLVYIVDDSNQLMTFAPQTKQFNTLGTLNCPATPDPFFGTPATPFSMAIDRDTSAWVLYSSGELFKVDTATLACTPTNWTAQAGLELFGMGFSTDAVGGTADTLYIAGGTTPGAGNATLASLDVNTMQATTRGTVAGSPELTGTGSAELWGFFPSGTGARVEKINKTSGGSAGQTFNLTSLNGEPTAWAFAFWGGDFWVFLMKDAETRTTVYQISGTTGQVVGSTPAPGAIVGAGVSTCAPTVIL